jgi:hypothetical protein
MAAQEAGHITGPQDKDYNIIWFVEQCLSKRPPPGDVRSRRRARR